MASALRGRPVLSALLLAVPLVCGCDASAPAANVVVRDSSGITIVEHGTLPDTGLSLRVEADPGVTIGVTAGAEAYQFQRVRGALRLTDGRIVVADYGSSQVRYFDSGGAHVRSVGRDGDGPGEFRFLSAIRRLASDSIVGVSLNTANAVSLFDPAGDFVRVLDYPSGREPIGILSNGGALYAGYAGTVPPATTGHVQDEIVLVAHREGGGVDTLMRLPGNQEFRQSWMNGIANGPVPFGRHVDVATHGSRVLVGIGSEGELRILENGRLARIIRFAAREVLTSAEIADWKAWRSSFARNPAQASLVADFIAAQTFPETRPVFSTVRVATDGAIWLERYHWNWQNPGAGRWYVLDPEGRSVATVDTPAGLRILDIGPDCILGVATDELGVESIRLHALVGAED